MTLCPSGDSQLTANRFLIPTRRSGLVRDEQPERALPGRLSGVLEMVKPRDKRSVEHLLHACYVDLDGSAGEGFGGFYVSAVRRSCEHPLVHAGDAIAGAAPQDPGLVLYGVHRGGHGEAKAGPG